MKKIEVIEKAKELYVLNHNIFGMCAAFMRVTGSIAFSKNFPEFNPKFFKSDAYLNKYWWPIGDRKSRLEAFDKLIEIYKNNTEEFIYDLIRKIFNHNS